MSSDTSLVETLAERREPRVPMSSPDLDPSDVQAVLEVLHSGRLALGPQAERLERGIADCVGVRHGVAVSSGTAALHLAVLGLGVGPGDEVLVPSFTFAASVNAILFAGATPVFVDVLPDVGTVDPTDLERKIGPKSRAVMVVDVFGHPAEWHAIQSLAESHGLVVIDDSCEALGAAVGDRMVGSFGDAAAFAFYPNKQITTGEGGVLVTDRDDLAELARSLRNQGRGAMGTWLEHERLGYNYRMDEMSAALGVSQLRRLEQFLEKRERVAAAYSARLGNVPRVRVPVPRPGVRMSWFVYVVQLASGIDREGVGAELEQRGIPSRGYFSPIHLQPYIRRQLGDLTGTLPVTEDLAGRCLALPFHNNLTDRDVDLVADALAQAIARTS